MRLPTAAGAAAILSVTALGSAVAVGRDGGHGNVCDFQRHHKVSIGFVITAGPSAGDATAESAQAASAATPSLALARALTSGEVPDPDLPGSWTRVHAPLPNMVLYFRGTGVSANGDVRAGQVVMGDLASFFLSKGKWTSQGASWSYCDPRQGRPQPSDADTTRQPGDVDYHLTFPQSELGDVGLECAIDTVTNVAFASKVVSDIYTRKPLTSLSFRALQQCVAVHHGKLTAT